MFHFIAICIIALSATCQATTTYRDPLPTGSFAYAVGSYLGKQSAGPLDETVYRWIERNAVAYFKFDFTKNGCPISRFEKGVLAVLRVSMQVGSPKTCMIRDYVIAGSNASVTVDSLPNDLSMFTPNDEYNGLRWDQVSSALDQLVERFPSLLDDEINRSQWTDFNISSCGFVFSVFDGTSSCSTDGTFIEALVVITGNWL